MELPNFENDFLSSLPTEKWAGKTIYQFNGFWYPRDNLLGIQKILSNFKPLPTDVILASYPKTGTTWLKSLLFSIIYRSSKEHLTVKNSHELVPCLEIHLYKPFGTILDYASINGSCPSLLTGSRIFSTHISYQIISDTLRSSACKIVYVTRAPKDTVVSLWHFCNRFVNREVQPIEIVVDKFCNGIVPFGPYYDHVLGYRKESLERPQNVFFITYEELKDDPKPHVKRLAQFLGCPFQDNGIGEEELEDIVRKCSFETLSNLEVNRSNAMIDSVVPCNSFYRKGVVGDYLNFLKPEMIQRIDEMTKEKFAALGFHYGI